MWENVGKGCCSGAGLEFSIREHGGFFGGPIRQLVVCMEHNFLELRLANFIYCKRFKVPGCLACSDDLISLFHYISLFIYISSCSHFEDVMIVFMINRL